MWGETEHLNMGGPGGGYDGEDLLRSAVQSLVWV
jgi:hypothetical protein